MSQPPPEPDARLAPAGFPGPGGFFDALRFVRHGMERIGAWAVYLPAVGVVLGAVWLATDRLVSALAGRAVSSVAVVLVAAVATRARPLLALGRTVAALPSGRERRLAVLEGGSGPLVSLCVAVVLATEIGVLLVLGRFRVAGLALAPMLGCCSMVVLAVGSRAARADGRRLKFAPDVTFREFAVASVSAFAVVSLSAEFLGLVLIFATAALTIAARVFFHRWIDGVNDTVLLATGEATQLLILALLAAL
jgi:cobalamin synthase